MDFEGIPRGTSYNLVTYWLYVYCCSGNKSYKNTAPASWHNRDKDTVYIVQCLSLLLLFNLCSEPALKFSLAPVSTVPPDPFGNVLGEDYFPGVYDAVHLAFPPCKSLSNIINLASSTKKKPEPNCQACLQVMAPVLM